MKIDKFTPLNAITDVWHPKTCYNGNMRRIKRDIIVAGKVAKIPVYTKGKIIYGLVDFSDFEIVDNTTWSLCSGYLYCKNRENGGYLHRVLLKPGAYQEVDHRDGNKLNNRRSNLRLVSHHQNSMAVHGSSSKHGYKGVQKHGSSYRAYIKFNSNQIRLGSYPTIERAARAYNQAAIALFGEYAVINKLEDKQ